MSNLVNKTTTSIKSNTNDSNKEKEAWNIGKSGIKFEPAQYLEGKFTVEKVESMLHNTNVIIAETMGKGRSLKVNILIDDSEIKFLGFLTDGDASVTLTKEDVAGIVEASAQGIKKAISTDDLMDRI